ncbi:putative RNA-directed DNA polymerase [Rosa chinensis]|uniref:Putative RNA-directed DNA polymerase n=1 Tax=Rosa chinensis TaxID=74649 RepID=A0A2P6QC11_ROSCH|nr:putative RNA-directed DNA polymerase [Rosa chinensis]
MADTTSELQWLKHLLQDLQVDLAAIPTLHCDNILALALALNPVHHSKLKHIEVDVHFTLDKVKDGSIRLQFVSTHDQLADLFTKGLCSPPHTYLCHQLQLGPSPPSPSVQLIQLDGFSTHPAEEGC